MNKNNTILPIDFPCLNENRLTDTEILNDDTTETKSNLDSGRAHIHDIIIIRMVKLFAATLRKFLSYIASPSKAYPHGIEEN